MSADEIQRLYESVKEESVKLEPSESNPEGAGIEEIEDFLKRYAKVLYPSHVLMIEKKYTLAKMYGRLKGYTVNELTDKQLTRKMNLCTEVLEMFDKTMPGRTRKRGMMMYELHLPLLILANKALQSGPNAQGGLSRGEIKRYLQRALENLKNGLDILGEEPEGSFEYQIVQGSKESLHQLEEYVKAVAKAL